MRALFTISLIVALWLTTSAQTEKITAGVHGAYLSMQGKESLMFDGQNSYGLSLQYRLDNTSIYVDHSFLSSHTEKHNYTEAGFVGHIQLLQFGIGMQFIKQTKTHIGGLGIALRAGLEIPVTKNRRVIVMPFASLGLNTVYNRETIFAGLQVCRVIL